MGDLSDAMSFLSGWRERQDAPSPERPVTRSLDTWSQAYEKRHGFAPGRGNDEDEIDALANLLWSQDEVARRGSPLSQRDWEQHYYGYKSGRDDSWRGYQSRARDLIGAAIRENEAPAIMRPAPQAQGFDQSAQKRRRVPGPPGPVYNSPTMRSGSSAPDLPAPTERRSPSEDAISRRYGPQSFDSPTVRSGGSLKPSAPSYLNAEGRPAAVPTRDPTLEDWRPQVQLRGPDPALVDRTMRDADAVSRMTRNVAAGATPQQALEEEITTYQLPFWGDFKQGFGFGEHKDMYGWVNGVQPGHPGIDYHVPMGTKLRPIAPGEVVGFGDFDADKGYPNSVGNWITIRDPYGEEWRYGHLTPGSHKWKVGDYVGPNDVLALSGNGGFARPTGYPHLHVDHWKVGADRSNEYRGRDDWHEMIGQRFQWLADVAASPPSPQRDAILEAEGIQVGSQPVPEPPRQAATRPAGKSAPMRNLAEMREYLDAEGRPRAAAPPRPAAPAPYLDANGRPRAANVPPSPTRPPLELFQQRERAAREEPTTPAWMLQLGAQTGGLRPPTLRVPTPPKPTAVELSSFQAQSPQSAIERAARAAGIAGQQVLGDATTSIGSAVQGIGTGLARFRPEAQQALSRWTGGRYQPYDQSVNPEGTVGYEFGRWLQEQGADLADVLQPGTEAEDWANKLPRMLGGAAPTAALAAATGPFAPLTGAAVGGLQGSARQFDAARQAGANVETAQRAADAGAIAGGITAGLPLGGRTLKQNVGLGGVMGGADAFINNLIARRYYDPERSLTEGMGEAATSGAILGGLFHLLAPPKTGDVTPGEALPHEADSIPLNTPLGREFNVYQVPPGLYPTGSGTGSRYIPRGSSSPDSDLILLNNPRHLYHEVGHALDQRGGFSPEIKEAFESEYTALLNREGFSAWKNDPALPYKLRPGEVLAEVFDKAMAGNVSAGFPLTGKLLTEYKNKIPSRNVTSGADYFPTPRSPSDRLTELRSRQELAFETPQGSDLLSPRMTQRRPVQREPLPDRLSAPETRIREQEITKLREQADAAILEQDFETHRELSRRASALEQEATPGFRLPEWLTSDIEQAPPETRQQVATALARDPDMLQSVVDEFNTRFQEEVSQIPPQATRQYVEYRLKEYQKQGGYGNYVNAWARSRTGYGADKAKAYLDPDVLLQTKPDGTIRTDKEGRPLVKPVSEWPVGARADFVKDLEGKFKAPAGDPARGIAQRRGGQVDLAEGVDRLLSEQAAPVWHVVDSFSKGKYDADPQRRAQRIAEVQDFFHLVHDVSGGRLRAELAVEDGQLGVNIVSNKTGKVYRSLRELSRTGASGSYSWRPEQRAVAEPGGSQTGQAPFVPAPDASPGATSPTSPPPAPPPPTSFTAVAAAAPPPPKQRRVGTALRAARTVLYPAAKALEFTTKLGGAALAGTVAYSLADEKSRERQTALTQQLVQKANSDLDYIFQDQEDWNVRQWVWPTIMRGFDKADEWKQVAAGLSMSAANLGYFGDSPDDAAAYQELLALRDQPLNDEQKRALVASMALTATGPAAQMRAYNRILAGEDPASVVQEEEDQLKSLVFETIFDPTALVGTVAGGAGRLLRGSTPIKDFSIRGLREANAAMKAMRGAEAARAIGDGNGFFKFLMWGLDRPNSLKNAFRLTKSKVAEDVGNAVLQLTARISGAETASQVWETTFNALNDPSLVEVFKGIDQGRLRKAFFDAVGGETAGRVVGLADESLLSKKIAEKLVGDMVTEVSQRAHNLNAPRALKAVDWFDNNVNQRIKNVLSTSLLPWWNFGFHITNSANNIATTLMDDGAHAIKGAVSLHSPETIIKWFEDTLGYAPDWMHESHSAMGTARNSLRLTDNWLTKRVPGLKNLPNPEVLAGLQSYAIGVQEYFPWLWKRGLMPATQEIGRTFGANDAQTMKLMEAASKSWNEAELVANVSEWAVRYGYDPATATAEARRLLNPVMQTARAGAFGAARQMRDFTLLNYADKTVLDPFLELVTPYSYWNTRSTANWVQRLVDNAPVISAYRRVQEGIEDGLNGDDPDTPDYLKKSVPIPIGEVRQATRENAEWVKQKAAGTVFEPSVRAMMDGLIDSKFLTGNADDTEKLYVDALSKLLPLNQVFWWAGSNKGYNREPEEDTLVNSFLDGMEAFPAALNPAVLVGLSWADHAWQAGGNKGFLDRNTFEASVPFAGERLIRGLSLLADDAGLFEGTGVEVPAAGWSLNPAWRAMAGYGYNRPQYEERRVGKFLADKVRKGELTQEEALQALWKQDNDAYEESVREMSRFYGDRGLVSALTSLLFRAEPHGELKAISNELYEKFGDENGKVDFSDPKVKEYLKAHPELGPYWAGNKYGHETRKGEAAEKYMYATTSQYSRKELGYRAWVELNELQNKDVTKFQAEDFETLSRHMTNASDLAALRAVQDKSATPQQQMQVAEAMERLISDMGSSPELEARRRAAEEGFETEAAKIDPKWRETETGYYDAEDKAAYEKAHPTLQKIRDLRARLKPEGLFPETEAARLHSLVENPPTEGSVEYALSIGLPSDQVDSMTRSELYEFTSSRKNEAAKAAGTTYDQIQPLETKHRTLKEQYGTEWRDHMPDDEEDQLDAYWGNLYVETEASAPTPTGKPSDKQIGFATEIGVYQDGMTKAQISRAVDAKWKVVAESLGTTAEYIEELNQRKDAGETLSDEDYRLRKEFWQKMYEGSPQAPQSSDRPSDKQIKYAKSLGVYQEGMTKREVSEAIDRAKNGAPQSQSNDYDAARNYLSGYKERQKSRRR